MFIKYNKNPGNLEVGDCVIRAIALFFGYSWNKVHDELCSLSGEMYDMPSSNRVWKQYLYEHGLKEVRIDTECPNCLTVWDSRMEICPQQMLRQWLVMETMVSVIGEMVLSGLSYCSYLLLWAMDGTMDLEETINVINSNLVINRIA